MNKHAWLFMGTHFIALVAANDSPKCNSASTKTIYIYLMNPHINADICECNTANIYITIVIRKIIDISIESILFHVITTEFFEILPRQNAHCFISKSFVLNW